MSVVTGNQLESSSDVVVTLPGSVTDTPRAAPLDLPAGHAVRAARVVLATLLLALPLWFGGVHPPAWLSATGLALTTALTIVAGSRGGVIQLLSPVERSALGLLLLLAVWALGQPLLLQMDRVAHPVLGEITGSPDPRGTSSFLLHLALFCAVTLLTMVVSSGPAGRRWVTGALLFGGALVTATALAHWLSDNGRLFWIFKPDHVFISPRARWPFVNSNHLGGYLLPILFLGLYRLRSLAGELATRRRRTRGGGLAPLTDTLNSRSAQRLAVRIGFLIILLVGVMLAIAGSLSRGAWIGLCAGLTAAFILRRLLPPAARLPALRSRGSGATHRRRRRSRGEPEPAGDVPQPFHRRLGRGLLILGLVLLFALFLRGRGAELVEDRIAYGLLHSKDDMRWQLLTDTLPMFQLHPLVGIGAGAWDELYPAWMASRLAGINPVYLHSDPVQFMLELGLLGTVLLLLLVGVLLLRAVRTLRAGTQDGELLIAVAAGLVALGVASLSDFHFRIPAILVEVAVLTGLAASLCGFDGPPKHPEVLGNSSPELS